MNQAVVAYGRPRVVRPEFLLQLLAAGLLPTATVSASTSLVPYGSAGVNYDSNLFKGGEQLTGEKAREDVSLTSTLGLSATYLNGDQKVRANAEGRRVIYDRTSELDHNEYEVSVGADVTALRALTDSIDYSRQRTLASYQNLGTTALTINTTQNLNNSLNLHLADRWETSLGFQRIESKTPLPDDPAFKLTSNSFSGDIRYLGSERASIGVTGGYGFGNYSGGAANRGNFSSYSVGTSAVYRVTGISNLAASLGMTARDDSVSGNAAPTFSGKVSYDRQVTGKTSIAVVFSRSLQSYSVGNSAFVQDSGQVSATWDASAKIKLFLVASQSYMKLLATNSTDPQLNGRKDRVQLADLQMTYSPRDWLSVIGSGGYQVQHSNHNANNFESVTGMLSVRARFE